MKLCNKPKFKSTCTLINDARSFVNTVHRSASLNQDWDRMCPLSLLGDVPTQFDSTFLLTSRLASEEVAAVLQDFVIQHSDKVTTNILPGTFHWNILKDFNRLMEPMWSSTPTIYVKDLKERGNQLRQYWQSKKRQPGNINCCPRSSGVLSRRC